MATTDSTVVRSTSTALMPSTPISYRIPNEAIHGSDSRYWNSAPAFW